MHYRQSLKMERRLEAVLRLTRAGENSTLANAEIIGVSIPTVSRRVEALRERGYIIKAEEGAVGWRYCLAGREQQSDFSKSLEATALAAYYKGASGQMAELDELTRAATVRSILPDGLLTTSDAC